MSPSDVWVIYNKWNGDILSVAPERFFVEREWDKLIKVPKIGIEKANKDTLVICTLARALAEINDEHKAKIDYLREEYDLAKQYALQ